MKTPMIKIISGIALLLAGTLLIMFLRDHIWWIDHGSSVFRDGVSTPSSVYRSTNSNVLLVELSESGELYLINREHHTIGIPNRSTFKMGAGFAFCRHATPTAVPMSKVEVNPLLTISGETIEFISMEQEKIRITTQ